MKTNKSYIKRLKITRNGKILARKAGQNHFNAKERTTHKTRKKQAIVIDFLKNKDKARFLPSYKV
jgi:ribosomal protein L35